MTFARIEMLFLIWAVPLLALVFWWGGRRRAAILGRYATPKLLPVITGEASASRRTVKALLTLAAVLFLVLALTGPRYGFRWQEVERKGVDIMVVLDCSRSMLATDIAPTRLDRAKREIIDLLAMMDGDRVGLVAFAGAAFLQCPLTLDYEAFHIFLDTLTPEMLPVGGTNIPAALTTALDGFEKEENTEKAIILITDGENTGIDPSESMEAAVAADVKVHCVGVGKTEGVPIPGRDGSFTKDRGGSIVLSRLDEPLLQQLARRTGGVYVPSVAGDMDLDLIYGQEIRGKLETATLASNRKKVWEDRYQWPLAVALAALMVELFIPAVRRATLILLVSVCLLAPAQYVEAASAADSMKKGRAAYEKGDYETALSHFTAAQLEEPDRAEIIFNVGNAYYRNGDFEKAYQHYEQAAKTEQADLKQRALYNLGNSAFRLNRLEEAVSHYQAAMKINPDDRKAAENIEFAKKMMEARKQAAQNSEEDGTRGQQQADQQQESRAQGDSGSRAEADKADSGDSDTRQQGDPQAGRQSPSGAGDDGSAPDQTADGSPASQPARDPMEGTNEKASTASSQAEESGAQQEISRQQADRMLNRLQDRPGAAAMPNYGKQNVEQDW